MATRTPAKRERVIEDSHALEPLPAELAQPPAPTTLFRTENPGEVVQRATETANALAKVVHDKHLTTKIQNRDHVRVEGWTLLGTMLGVFPVCVWTHKLENGWEARVEARTRNGEVVGAAEAQCLRSERNWGDRDDFALRSMAQTRATSKALRQPLGFVMTLAGFEATPAEEMTTGGTGFAAASDGGEPTPAQIKKVQALITKLDKADIGLDRETVKKTFGEWYGTESVKELSRAQISELIERLEEAERRHLG